MYYQNNQSSQKKKSINIKNKTNLPSESPFQDFKQNHHKPKPSQQHNQPQNRTSNRHLHNAPFSSVLNTKPYHKNSEPPKPIQKPYESQTTHPQKKDQHFKTPKQQTKKYIEKMIENKLNHMIQNKLKSFSFRAHPNPKQNIHQQQKRKQSYHLQETKKQLYNKLQQKQEKQEHKTLVINKQKSSLFFIIRKKISSNVIQSERNCDKAGKNYGIQSFEKEEFIKSQNSKYPNAAISKDPKNTSQNCPLPKYAYKPMDEQLKKLKKRHPQNKQMSIKPQQINGMKCLKVRVNKVLKAQEQLFNEKYFPKDKKQQQVSQSNKVEKIYNQGLIKEGQVKQQVFKDQEISEQLGQRLITIDQILQKQRRKQETNQVKQQISHHLQESINQSNFVDTQESKKNNSVQPIVEAKTQQNGIQKPRGQVKWKSYKQTQHQPNAQNRKRISSIRAIKNYYKKLDTEEKSSFISNDKESKQGTNIKKKETAGCLTHKIKWGSSSKRKLNSDRIPVEALTHNNNYLHEFSMDGKNDGINERKGQNHRKFEHQNNQLKATIEAKLAVAPTIKKKPFNKVQFLQEQFLKAKHQTTPKANKNLQKIFAQTINSKQFIDCDMIPFYAGSKSLIIFEDPGISMIINNNNSIHSPTYPLGFNGLPSRQLASIENQSLSPVAMGKTRAYEVVEKKCQEEQNPLESLQELYFELKSRKDINPKPNNHEFRIESLQELCEG